MKNLFKLLSVFSFILIVFAFTLTSVGFCTACAQVSVESKACYLYDFNTGTEIYKHNENERLQIASMTKIMLLDLVYENVENNNLDINEKIIVSENASSMGGSQVFLENGGSYLVSDLIKSVTVASANDASVALAERLYGSEEECVKKMNEKAESLGLKNTLFANCTGLPKPMQYSSAKDIVMIFCDLIKHDSYFDYSNIWMDKIEHSKNTTEIANTNKLIKYYQGCDGGKTGFTNDAGFCLTATAKRGNMRLVSSVIGAPDSKVRFKESSNLLNYGFNSFVNKAVLDKNIPLDGKIDVLNGKIKQVEVVPENNFYVFSARNGNDKIECDYQTNNVSAPVNKGDVVGKATIYKNGVLVGSVNLVSNANVEKMSYFDYIIEISKNM